MKFLITTQSAVAGVLIMSGSAVSAMTLPSDLVITQSNNPCKTELDAINDANMQSLTPSERLLKARAAQNCLAELKANMTSLNTHYLSVASTATELTAAKDAATNAKSAGNSAASTDTDTQKVTETANQASLSTDFLGANWGVGIGYAWGQGPKRVTATVVNNIVRVSSDTTDGPRIYLEAHIYPELWNPKSGTWGWGPFATIEAGGNSSNSASGLTGFGLGLMAGWRVDKTSSSGFNIGLGYIWEGNVQTLGDGIVADQPLPSGETQIRYKNQSVRALSVMFSWKFGSSIPTANVPSGK